jgi:hypothetical protein
LGVATLSRIVSLIVGLMQSVKEILMLLRSLIISLLVSGLSMPVMAQNCDSNIPATAPMSRFKEGANGIITDKNTGNVWLRCPVGMKWEGGSCGGNSLSYTWSEAVVVIDELNAQKVAGRSDWRLPKIDELMSIVEPRCFKPAIDLDVFPFSPESGFWTDTAVEGVQPRAWVVHFLNGKQYIANKNQTWRVRLIAGK